jgi:hypothetical protein
MRNGARAPLATRRPDHPGQLPHFQRGSARSSQASGRRSSCERFAVGLALCGASTFVLAACAGLSAVFPSFSCATWSETESAEDRTTTEEILMSTYDDRPMKFSWHWRKRQKYVQNCIIRSASRQGIDIWEVRSRANMGGLPIQELDDLTFVFSRPRR